MLVIAGTIRLDPAKRDAAIAAAKAVMAATGKEPGNNAYVFSADLTDDGLFHIFEEWVDEAALGAHFQAPHMAEFGKAMGGFGVKESKLTKYEVSGSGDL